MEETASEQYGKRLRGDMVRLYGYRSTSFIHTDLKVVFREGHRVFELPESLRDRRSHDLENCLAAYALCADKGIEGEEFIAAWRSFKKPPHRVEFVAEYQEVKYYDDSKGTNIDAVIRAVESLDGPLILIAGGVDKGAPYLPWLQGFKNKVKWICAIGEAAGKIRDQLTPYIPVEIFPSLVEAVKQASLIANRGDSVLLSPGCASFDMFKDYAHRGETFQQIVRELEGHSSDHPVESST